jgi:hypothetical protein
MKRILLSGLLSCLSVGQVQCLYSELASGFALSSAMQSGIAALNYTCVSPASNRYKAAVEAVYPVSMALMVGASSMAYLFRLKREVIHANRRFEEVLYGAALGSLTGFAGCIAAWYYGKI